MLNKHCTTEQYFEPMRQAGLLSVGPNVGPAHHTKVPFAVVKRHWVLKTEFLRVFLNSPSLMVLIYEQFVPAGHLVPLSALKVTTNIHFRVM